MNQIKWKPVVGYEGRYIVSEHGAVMRVARLQPRAKGGVYSVSAKLLSAVAAGHRRGYLGVALRSPSGSTRVHLVHRLVAAAFCARPDGCDHVNHINLDKHDNRAENLEWVTAAQNQAHAATRGRFHGRTNPRARFKLDPTQVDAILAELAAGHSTQYQIAEAYGISQAMVSMIKTRKTWANPPGEYGE